MQVTMAYRGRSELRNHGSGASLAFAPNLARDPVAFDAALRHPLRFREAISALHDVVVSDLRFQPRDKQAYEDWKRTERERVATLRREEFQRAKDEILEQRGDVPPNLERDYERLRRKYWNARQKYSSYLLKHDQEMWRRLMPCDPVITVHDDVVFFECFSADESSYGCLTVDRDAGFGTSGDLQFGTTNVDYSWDLFDHFQSLRSYRETRFQVDPAGFDVATEGTAWHREEKIDLPDGWLRGFMQIQAAMALPMRRVSLSPETVYSLLAWQKRHRAKKSPRALRFELQPDRPPVLMLEPWERRFDSHGTISAGPPGPPIRIWGTRRLVVLARLLPLADRFDVYLLGTGLPSFWVARMGEMRLVLGLSGWTTNDWTRSSALDLLAPPTDPTRDEIERVAVRLREKQAATFGDLSGATSLDAATCGAVLNHLAHSGQAIYDLDGGVYRWRQIMPMALGEAEIGPENPELAASRQMVVRGRASISEKQEAPGGGTLAIGEAEGKPVEVLVDLDGFVKRAKCVCGHCRRGGLRMGPCRYVLAIRQLVVGGTESETATSNWYERFANWAEN